MAEPAQGSCCPIATDGERHGACKARRRRLKRLLLLSTCLCPALLGGPHAALAQSSASPAGSTITLDPVVVEGQAETATGPVRGIIATRSATGAKTDTPLIETPQAITVIGAEQMDLQKPTSVVQATRYAPGIRSESFGADARNDWFIIRGFPQQTTGYFLDGTQLFSTAFATWKLEPWSLERIEVLRGPASTLYGGGDPGGLINAVSKRPPTVAGGAAETGVDSHGNGYGAIDVGGPIGQSGQWFYRLTALGRAGGTQTDYTNNERIHIAPALTWRPNEDTSITVLASYTRDWTRGQNFLPYVGTVVNAPYGRISTKLFTSNPDSDHFRREQAMVGYQLQHRVNDVWTVRQNARFNYLSLDFQTLYGVGYDGPPANGLLARGNFVTRPTAYQFNLDSQAEARFTTGAFGHTLLLGVDFKRYRIDDEQGYAAGPSLNLLNPVYTPVAPVTSRYTLATITQTQVGFYAQDQIKLGRLSLTLGGRYDTVNTGLDNHLTPSGSATNDAGRFTGRAALMYTTDFGLAPYVSYATSFNPQVGINAATGGILAPETGRGVEVGVKYRPTGWNVTFAAALFEINRQNVSTTIYTPAFQTAQIGAIRSRGFELEAAIDLAQGLKLIASYSLADPRVTNDLNLAAIGHTPAGIPRQSGSIWVNYVLQSGPLEGLGASAGLRYVGTSFADAANSLPVPAYTLVDAGLQYRYRNWDFRLNVTNLFDTVHVSSCSSASACFYGDRRRATLAATYRW